MGIFEKIAAGAAAISLAAGAAAGAAAQSLEDFAAMPATWNAALSPDGGLLAVGCDQAGRRAVCAFDLNAGAPLGGFSPPTGYRMVDFYFASPEHLILTVTFLEEVEFTSGFQDVVVARALSLHVPTGEVTALLRGQSGYSNTAGISHLLPSDPDAVYISLRDRVFSVDLNSGIGRLADRGSAGRVFDADGEVVLRLFTSGRDDVRIRRVEGNEVIYEGVHTLDTPSIGGFLDDTGVLFTFPEGERRGHYRLDVETGEITELGVGVQGNLYNPIIDPLTRRVTGVRVLREGMSVPIWLDDGLKADAEALAGALGVEAVDILSYSADRSRMLVRPALTPAPGIIYLYDRDAGALSIAAESYPGLGGAELGRVEAIRYEASDGLEIEAILTWPPGADAQDGPLPLVVMPHGGPYARDTLEFDWWARAYAHMGYLVLKPNFRGSSGYGQDFRDAGFGEFGGRMIEDILDGARHLQAEGLARPGGYCMAGASYGGYAVLMGAVRAPEEVACVIAHSPVTRPLEFIGDAVRADSELGVEWWERYMGSRFMDEESARSISPHFLADQIRAPLLIVHGSEDTTVPISQSESLVNELRGRENFEFIVLEDDDHFLSLEQSRLTLLQRSAALLQTHLPAQ